MNGTGFLYEPLGVLKPFGDGVWIVDGPVVRMNVLGPRFPFPTRMTVVRLDDGGLFLHSPIEPTSTLIDQVRALGPVRHLVSPNRLHYVHIAAWKAAFPDAIAWASPGVEARARSQGIAVSFDQALGEEPPDAWREEIDQLIFEGSRIVEEVVFFHRASGTLLLTDLIENFEPERLGRLAGLVMRLSGAAHPDGSTPIDLRLSLLGRRAEARASLERMRAWPVERIVITHGRCFESGGSDELARAFRWLT